MNSFDPPHQHLPRTNWQILGRLKLGADSNPNGNIRTWLIDVLSDFSIPGDLVKRLVASIEEATARILRSYDGEGPFGYLDLVVLGPPGQKFEGQTWGFFRLEKGSTDLQIESAKRHCIEYYLYVDKKRENGHQRSDGKFSSLL